MKIGILCPLATFELHGVTDEIQAVAVMIKVRLHMFGKAGLRTAQRLVHHHEHPVKPGVRLITQDVAKRQVGLGKQVVSKPHLMPVAYVYLSVDFAHCVRGKCNVDQLITSLFDTFIGFA